MLLVFQYLHEDLPTAQRRAMQTQGFLPLAHGSLVEVSNKGDSTRSSNSHLRHSGMISRQIFYNFGRLATYSDAGTCFDPCFLSAFSLLNPPSCGAWLAIEYVAPMSFLFVISSKKFLSKLQINTQVATSKPRELDG